MCTLAHIYYLCSGCLARHQAVIRQFACEDRRNSNWLCRCVRRPDPEDQWEQRGVELDEAGERRGRGIIRRVGCIIWVEPARCWECLWREIRG